MEIGTRVMALSHQDGEIMYSYGEGELLGDVVPGTNPEYPVPAGAVAAMREAKVANPLIKLDSGKYVWGCECWWGPIDKVQPKLVGMKVEIADIDVEREKIRAEEEKERQEEEARNPSPKVEHECGEDCKQGCDECREPGLKIRPDKDKVIMDLGIGYLKMEPYQARKLAEDFNKAADVAEAFAKGETSGSNEHSEDLH